MLSPSLIGAITLNVSFVLYLLVYVPQILHNRHTHHLAHLSIGMHSLLYMGYCLDLLYGFSHHLQWQYKTVSMVGFSLLVFQHLQLMRYFGMQRKWPWVHMSGLLLMSALGVLYFFIQQKAQVSENNTLAIGYLSRLCFLLYTLPQIIKNKTLQSANAISLKFIYFSMTLSLLDLISAWCLDWGWPNKLATPIMLSLMGILLMQRKKYGLNRRSSKGLTRGCEIGPVPLL